MIVGDDFQSGIDAQALVDRPPTGPNAGTAWALGQPAGAAVYVLASKWAADNNSSGGNRHRMTDSLGMDVMDVEGDVSFSAAPGGVVVGAGVSARKPNSTATDGWDFFYDGGVSAWSLDDGTTVTTFAEAYPGGTVTLRLEARQGLQKCYVNGVLKITGALTTFAGNTRAGVVLLNFTGGATQQSRISRFVASSVPALVPFVGGRTIYKLAPQRWG